MISFPRTLRLRVWLLLVAATILIVAADRRLVEYGLRAVYFDGPDWRDTGTAVTGVDATPSSTVLREHRPDFFDRPFSVEWRGYIVVPRSGSYTLATISDDGSWLYIDSKLIVANPGKHGPLEARGAVALDQGLHPIFIRYFQDGGGADLEALWGSGSGPLEAVPASAFVTEPVSYARIVAQRANHVALIVVVILWAGIGLVAAGRPAIHGFRSLWFEAFDRAFRPVLLISILLNAWGIWWGLPNTRGWAPDELVPIDVLDAARVFFSHGWHTKYPPFHYALLTMAHSPLWLLSWLRLVDLRMPGPYLTLFLIGRFVSLAMSAGTIVMVYLCARRLYGSTGAVFAALTTALTVPFAYYGMLTNLEAPYLFWFAVSLFAYIRILQDHARRDYILFAIGAALAVSTKDQAYGLYVLTPLAILVARWLQSRRPGDSPAREGFATTTLMTALVAIGIFLIAENVIFNFSGFVGHVQEITGPTSSAYQRFPGTPAGQLQMFALAVRELGYMFGWPLSVIVAAALVSGMAWTTMRPSMRWLVVPAASYYVMFLAIVLYFYDRFLLPITLVLSLFAGWWIERFIRQGARARRLRVGLVTGAFVYGVVYVATIKLAMTRDSRYVVTEWLRAHAGTKRIVAARGPLEFFLIADAFASVSVESLRDVEDLHPDFIVLNPNQVVSLPPDHSIQALRAALLTGTAGYRLAIRYRTPALPWPGRHPDLGDVPRNPEASSLSHINPTLEVFERIRF